MLSKPISESKITITFIPCSICPIVFTCVFHILFKTHFTVYEKHNLLLVAVSCIIYCSVPPSTWKQDRRGKNR